MSDPNRSPRTAFQPPPTLIPTPAGGAPSLIPGDSLGVDNDVTDHLKVQLLVRAYQVPTQPNHPSLIPGPWSSQSQNRSIGDKVCCRFRLQNRVLPPFLV